IPLGGSRGTKWQVVRNTFVIFLVSGFWHGANWTFIAWGAYHAILFLPLILIGKNRKFTNTVAEGKVLPNFKEIFQMLFTFLLVVFGWILFRAENMAHAWEYISGIFSPSLFTAPTTNNATNTLVLTAFCLITEWLNRHKQHGLQIDSIKYKAVRWAVYFTLIIIIWAFGGQGETFIYFQF
ncbi:MAG: MBOAT family protein, partial [Paludibacter sp.]|nr:MBOAT family protein [Paludibacter sp.]